MYSLGLCVRKFNNHHQIATVNTEDPKQWQSFNVEILRKYTKRVMRQLLTILCQLHGNNLVHRFICPESIKWRWNTKGKPDIALGNLFLIEVNKIGSMLPDGAPETPFTGPYFPPEFFWTEALVAPNSDIYTAGVIFAELLLNDLPDTRIMSIYGRTFPVAAVTDSDPRWRSVDRRAVRMLKNIFGNPILRKTANELLRSSYFH